MKSETGKMHNILGRFRARGWYLVYNKPDHVWVGAWCPKEYLPEGVSNIMVDVPVERGTWTLDPDRPIYGYVYSESQGREMAIFECKGKIGQVTFDHFTDWVFDLLNYFGNNLEEVNSFYHGLSNYKGTDGPQG